MSAEPMPYQIWIDPAAAVASFHPVRGYERLSYKTRALYDARVRILVQAGFRFQ